MKVGDLVTWGPRRRPRGLRGRLGWVARAAFRYRIGNVPRIWKVYYDGKTETKREEWLKVLS